MFEKDAFDVIDEDVARAVVESFSEISDEEELPVVSRNAAASYDKIPDETNSSEIPDEVNKMDVDGFLKIVNACGKRLRVRNAPTLRNRATRPLLVQLNLT